MRLKFIAMMKPRCLYQLADLVPLQLDFVWTDASADTGDTESTLQHGFGAIWKSYVVVKDWSLFKRAPLGQKSHFDDMKAWIPYKDVNLSSTLLEQIAADIALAALFQRHLLPRHQSIFSAFDNLSASYNINKYRLYHMPRLNEYSNRIFHQLGGGGSAEIMLVLQGPPHDREI